MGSRIPIDTQCFLDLDDVTFDAVRSSGPGGQNVNKVATAVQLRLDLNTARLPETLKERVRGLGDRRVSAEGVIVIKAQRHRTQLRNREDALARLVALLQKGLQRQPQRLPTRPTRASRERRLATKGIRSKNKRLRQKPAIE